MMLLTKRVHFGVLPTRMSWSSRHFWHSLSQTVPCCHIADATPPMQGGNRLPRDESPQWLQGPCLLSSCAGYKIHTWPHILDSHEFVPGTDREMQSNRSNFPQMKAFSSVRISSLFEQMALELVAFRLLQRLATSPHDELQLTWRASVHHGSIFSCLTSIPF